MDTLKGVIVVFQVIVTTPNELILEIFAVKMGFYYFFFVIIVVTF
jgi:hypothetical protein